LIARHEILRLQLPFAALDRGLGVIGKRGLIGVLSGKTDAALRTRLREDHAAAFDLARGSAYSRSPD